MPCSPQKQPPASTAVWRPVASAAGVSTAGAGITLLIASAPTRQAIPQAASVRAAAMVLIWVFIGSPSEEWVGQERSASTLPLYTRAQGGVDSGEGLDRSAPCNKRCREFVVDLPHGAR